jgi:putative ATP-dependent endonuclease of OLD family
VQEEIAKPDVSPLQVFITTHSPNLSSKVNVENLILLTSEDSNAYSLGKDVTKANDDDYKFLTKFLDTTKANMFFAKGLIFVEGFSEEVLFPVFAKMMGYDLEDYGVSVISINGTSHERYAKILQRRDETELPIPVSFVRDADNLKDTTLSDKKENIETATMLKFFSSSEKTLEYDVAKSMWQQSCATLKSLYVNLPAAIKTIETSDYNSKKDDFYNAINGSRGKSEFAYKLSQDLMDNQSDWENLRDNIPEYIKNAITHVVNIIVPTINNSQ